MQDYKKTEEPEITITNAMPAGASGPYAAQPGQPPIPQGHSRFYCEKCRTVRFQEQEEEEEEATQNIRHGKRNLRMTTTREKNPQDESHAKVLRVLCVCVCVCVCLFRPCHSLYLKQLYSPILP